VPQSAVAHDIARAFVAARQTGESLARYPGPAPVDMAEAYDIQDHAIALIGEPILGWKVGRIAPHLHSQFGATCLSGPIFSVVDAEPTTPVAAPVLSGFAAAEAELVLRLRADAPVGLDATSVADFIEEVRFGIEIASSPFPGINDHGPAVTASDCGNNFGLVLGPRVADWRGGALVGASVSLDIDGENGGLGQVAAGAMGPFGAVAFLVDHLRARGLAWPNGVWVSSGALTGVHRVRPGQVVTARFGDSIGVACQITPLQTALRPAAEGAHAPA
jgi:2-keto-4-pentenoate hydratase